MIKYAKLWMKIMLLFWKILISIKKYETQLWYERSLVELWNIMHSEPTPQSATAPLYMNAGKKLTFHIFLEVMRGYVCQVSYTLWIPLMSLLSKYNSSSLSSLRVACEEHEKRGWLYPSISVCIYFKNTWKQPAFAKSRLGGWFTPPICTHTISIV